MCSWSLPIVWEHNDSFPPNTKLCNIKRRGFGLSVLHLWADWRWRGNEIFSAITKTLDSRKVFFFFWLSETFWSFSDSGDLGHLNISGLPTSHHGTTTKFNSHRWRNSWEEDEIPLFWFYPLLSRQRLLLLKPIIFHQGSSITAVTLVLWPFSRLPLKNWKMKAVLWGCESISYMKVIDMKHRWS